MSSPRGAELVARYFVVEEELPCSEEEIASLVQTLVQMRAWGSGFDSLVRDVEGINTAAHLPPCG